MIDAYLEPEIKPVYVESEVYEIEFTEDEYDAFEDTMTLEERLTRAFSKIA